MFHLPPGDPGLHFGNQCFRKQARLDSLLILARTGMSVVMVTVWGGEGTSKRANNEQHCLMKS